MSDEIPTDEAAFNKTSKAGKFNNPVDAAMELLFGRTERNSSSYFDSAVVTRVLVVITAIGFGVIYASQRNSPYIPMMAALAAELTGALAGFLFGIPRVVQTQGAALPSVSQMQNDNKTPATGSSGDEPSRSHMAVIAASETGALRFNTNLEQISDWITKIVVGLGLANIPAIGQGFHRLASMISRDVGEPRYYTFALGIVVYFPIVGFLFTYILTQIAMTGALRRAMQDSNT